MSVHDGRFALLPPGPLQVVQVAAASFLHFDLKFAQLEFQIQRLTSASESAATKLELCTRLRDALPCNLGIFLRHFRKRFASVEEMQSPLALATLLAREANKRFTTVASERGHATERRDLQSGVGPGKVFCHHARANLVAQVATRHKEHHGSDLAKSLRGGAQATVAAVAADPFSAVLPELFLQPLNSIDGREAAIEEFHRQPLLDRVRIAQAGAASQLVLAGAPAGRPAAGAADEQPLKSGKGGSIYQTIHRMKLKSFKAMVGQRILTPLELQSIAADARCEWQESRAAGGDRWHAWLRIYSSEVEDRQRGVVAAAVSPSSGSAVVNTYRPQFHLVGDPKWPVQPTAFVSHMRSAKYPSGDKVYRDRSCIIGPEDVIYPLRGVCKLWLCSFPTYWVNECTPKHMLHI